MPYVSLIVEALRARPAAVALWVIVAQGLIWALLPTLFYASPPGELPEALAIGHEWQLGSRLGPPLSFWAAELAFRAAGGHAAGVYLLAQLCIGIGIWAVFRLGRAIAGGQHAALAVLLSGGILALTLPTPEFGPAVLAVPLTGLALLCFWRALEGRRNAWIALAFALGLLLMTSYWGLLVFALMALFLPATRAGRAALGTVDPWAAGVLALMLPFPHWVWLWQSGGAAMPFGLLSPELVGRLAFWPLQLVGILALHAGLIALALLASGWRADPKLLPPVIEGPPPPPAGRAFVLFFAIALPLIGSLGASVMDAGGTAGWAAPLLLLSGLAVVVAAGRRIALYRQRVVGVAWLVILLLPPAVLVTALFATPWTGAMEWDSEQPAAAMGTFFTDTYRRRTGRPLQVVVGDNRAVYLVALASPDRPRVYAPADPARTPWLTAAEVRARGAIALWDLREQSAQAPAVIATNFPALVVDVPQSFERPVQGLMPALRLGWGLLRPAPPPK